MMLFFIPACILTVMLLVSLVRERRRFRNGVYLFFALMFWYMFVLEFSFSHSLPALWQILVRFYSSECLCPCLALPYF